VVFGGDFTGSKEPENKKAVFAASLRRRRGCDYWNVRMPIKFGSVQVAMNYQVDVPAKGFHELIKPLTVMGKQQVIQSPACATNSTAVNA